MAGRQGASGLVFVHRAATNVYQMQYKSGVHGGIDVKREHLVVWFPFLGAVAKSYQLSGLLIGPVLPVNMHTHRPESSHRQRDEVPADRSS